MTYAPPTSGEHMNGPKIGEKYDRCPHAAEGKQHWWNSKGRWIALCPACHKLYGARKPVALVGAVRSESAQIASSFDVGVGKSVAGVARMLNRPSGKGGKHGGAG